MSGIVSLPINPHTDRLRGPIADRYDAIVIGAGIGGLTCAARLATAGLHVLVIDQHYVAGGYATTFRRTPWEFDVGLHYLGECHPGGLIPTILEECGVSSGVEFRPMSHDLEDVRIGDTRFLVPGSFDDFQSRLLYRFPTEERGIDHYFQFLAETDRVVGSPSLFETNGKPRAAAGGVFREHAHHTLGQLLDACTSNSLLRAILGSQHINYGVIPGRVSAVSHTPISGAAGGIRLEVARR